MTEPVVESPPPAARRSYEFSKLENSTISRTARWTRALAVMFFISTFVQVINLKILGILVDLAIGVTFWKGAKLLDSVVDTEGDDVPNMLGALTQLQTAFTVRIIITAIATGIALVVSVGFFVQYKFLAEAVADAPAVTIDDAEEGERPGDDDAPTPAPDEAAPAVKGADDVASDGAAEDAPPPGAVPAAD